MSGALNSVFSNPIGAILNVASVAFPPLGIATSVANLVTQGVGQAVNQAAQLLTQTAGMPKFLLDTIGGLVKDVVGQLTQHSEPDCDEAAHAHFGGDIQSLIQSLATQITHGAKSIMEQGETEGTKGGGKKGGAASWLVAMARAMGGSAGEHMKNMVNLSNKINDLTAKGTGMDTKTDEGKDAYAKNSAEVSAAQAELQAEGQMFSMLQNAFSNVIKSIGEGMTTMARKG
jgi:hypothetical protein